MEKIQNVDITVTTPPEREKNTLNTIKDILFYIIQWTWGFSVNIVGGIAGSIYTEKPGEGNVYWAATFSIPPLAKDAKLISKLELPH